MNADATYATPPTRRIWLRFLLLLPLVAVLAVASYAHVRANCATNSVWTPPLAFEEYGVYGGYDSFGIEDVVLDTPGVVRVVDVKHGRDGAACVTFEALSEGETGATFGGDDLSCYWHLKVKDGAVIEGNVNFSGWEAVHISWCVFVAAVAALFASVVVQLQRRRWFGYAMVASCGGMLFMLFQLAVFVFAFWRGSLRSFADLAYQIGAMAEYFVLITTVPMAILGLLVCASNIALVRYEGMRLANLLGFALSFVWLAAIGVWVNWWDITADLGWPHAVLTAIDSFVVTMVAYGESLLLATILCGLMAAHTKPNHAADYLVVLGCGIRPDGTPTPLLAGRVDRACAFDSACQAAGAAPADFVPSGGQGPDEVISEAQSMRDYLVGKGVAPERIVLEDRSTTTRENMEYSRAVIQEHAGCDTRDLDIVFSTTNYHVFRGYVCAHEAGMAAQGVGSKTRAYFWPNAFLREFAGLLAHQWKSILQTYLIIAAIYAFAEYVLALM